MEAFNVLLWTTQRAALALDECQSLTFRIAHTLQSWWGHLVGEHAHGLNHRLGIGGDSLCRVLRQVHLELVVLAAVDSTEQHAQKVALAAYFFGFDDCRLICRVNVFGPHSLSNKLHATSPGSQPYAPLYVSTTPTRALKCSTYYSVSVLVTSWVW